MTESDLSGVLEIEQHAFPDPWPESSFLECLSYGYCCRVLEQGGVIHAYGIMALDSYSAHVLNLCVRPELRKQNLGRTLLGHLLEQAGAAHVEAVFLEVRASNEPALKLYESAGFFQIGIRRGYYRGPDGREDALILVYKPAAATLTS